MRTNPRGISLLLFVLMALGTLCGLYAGFKRLNIERGNRRVEVALEWQEVSTLAQSLGKSPSETLRQLNSSGLISTLVLQEDTITQMEQSGAIHVESQPMPNGKLFTTVTAFSPETLERIRKALQMRGYRILDFPSTVTPPAGTLFTSRPTEGKSADFVFVPNDYASLRLMGLGLLQDGISAAREAHLRMAGRIANFPGVSSKAAEQVLKSLRDQMATQDAEPPVVIFSGEEVLGYRDMEPQVAAMLRDPHPHDPNAPLADSLEKLRKQNSLPEPIGLTYGEVEFSKQKGDEKLSAALKGDYVRVHSIQAAEMGQLSEDDAIERFVRAARERNIRFCYVRLLTFAGDDCLIRNKEYLRKIQAGMLNGRSWTGQLAFGSTDKGAKRYADPAVSRTLFMLIGLGVAAGTVWMLALFCPLPEQAQWRLLALLALACMGMTLGETGRKLTALLAGIVFPAAACLLTFPVADRNLQLAPTALSRCMGGALRMLTLASLITGIGIAHVIGLLASRPFMVHAEQFMGIKAQHAIPLLIVVLAALMGGAGLPGETWAEYKERATRGFRNALNEPARFGTLILFIVAIAALALVVARTGNDAGVGVSGAELKARAILDKILPVRPRTKEFLVGHPLFVLGAAWWLRGRRKLALPCFVAGSLGQVSLLNTFCHIHTPLILSFWRDMIGLIFGAVIGLALFWLVERLWPTPPLKS